MRRGGSGAATWGLEGAAVAACVLLVVERLASVHSGVTVERAATVAVLAAVALAVASVLARRDAPGVAVVVLALLVGGVATSSNGKAAVVAFALAAAVPLVAVTLWRPVDPRAVVPLVLATALACAARIWFRDPFRELACEPFCDPNPFLVSHRPQVVRASEVLVVVATAWAVVWILARRPRVSAGLVLALVLAALAAARLALRPRPVPDSTIDVTLDVAELAVATLIALVGLGAAWRVLAERRQVRRFVTALADAREVSDVERSLRAATRDPTLEVRLGEVVEPVPAGRQRTAVVRHERTVATLTHRPRTRAVLGSALNASVALGLETLLLLEEAERQVAAVDASRAAVVQSTDAARRALERNLHDGAQQHLLVVGMALVAAGEEVPGPRQCVADAADDVTQALRELRRIARGDAATIAEIGFANAVSSLAGVAAVDLRAEVDGCGDRDHACWPVPTSTAAYRLLVSTVAEAEAAGASSVWCDARCLGEGAGRRIRAGHDGGDGRDRDRTLDRDRILAAGGQVSFDAGARERLVEAWLP